MSTNTTNGHQRSHGSIDSMRSVDNEDDDQFGSLVLFSDRPTDADTISPEQALVHLIKVMMGTGMLSLPLAFKQSGLWLSLILLVLICLLCLYTSRQLVFSAHYISSRTGRECLDYANVMRLAVEAGPDWIRDKGYIAKQIVNINVFIAQFGFCCVYFVFMADNIKQFADEVTFISISLTGWIALMSIPILALCSIRQLNALAPLAFAANIIYMIAVSTVIVYLLSDITSYQSSRLPAFGNWHNLPLFIGTVLFAFEGVAVILPIENRMNQPQHFISYNGVLNTACLLVLALYACVGFFGYLRFGDQVADTITLNLPNTPFYQIIKLMFVTCIMISYPIQFYVPLERIEKWISRKISASKQTTCVYAVRFVCVLITCALAVLIPHLALFISFIGSFASTSITLLFPPIIDLLINYSQRRLTRMIWIKNGCLILFAAFGFFTGTYASVIKIIEEFGKFDV